MPSISRFLSVAAVLFFISPAPAHAQTGPIFFDGSVPNAPGFQVLYSNNPPLLPATVTIYPVCGTFQPGGPEGSQVYFVYSIASFGSVPQPPWISFSPSSYSIICGEAPATIQMTIDPTAITIDPTQQTSVSIGIVANFGANPTFVDQNGNAFTLAFASCFPLVYWCTASEFDVTVTYIPPPPPPPTTSSTDMGPCDECEAQGGAPINFMTGDVWLAKTDYSVPGLAGGLSVGRTWNSFWQQRTSPAPVFQAGMFGQGWISNLEERLQQQDSTHINYWRADGNLWTFLQGTSGSSTTVAYSILSPQNHHAVLLYDNTALLYTMTFPDGSQKIFDSNGYLQSWSDRNGNTTTISYDSSQRITQVTAPGGQFLKFTYANAQFPNLASSAQDSVGAVANYSYTGQLLAQVTYADASALQYGYDANNNISSVTDAQGKVIETHTYDSQGRGLTSSNANGVNAMTLQYVPAEQTTLTDSKGNTTNYAIFPYGGRYRVMGAYGPTCATCGAEPNASFDYDQFGNQLDVFDASTNEDKSYTYDSVGNVTALDYYVTLNGVNQDVNYTYTYNNFGEVLTVSDPLGNTTTNTYDANGNLLSTTTPSPGGTAPGNTTTFTYDTKGEVLTVTDARNNTTTMAYTPGGLISSTTDAQGHVSSFAYDGRGNRTSATDAAGQTTNFTFDSMNHVTKIAYPDSSTTQFAYDTRGRRISVTDANNESTSYAYDDADRLVSVTDAAGHATGYGYDTENNLTSVTDAAGHTTGFAYDANRRLTQTTFPSSLTETYSYDVDGNMLTKTDRKGNTISYIYDQLSRLTQKTYLDSTSVGYTYDLASHLTQVSDATGTYQFTYDGLGRLSQASTQYAFLTGQTLANSYAYDADSNRASLTNPQGGVTNYAYDSLNRLGNVTDFAGRAFGFSYDALSRRTGLTRPNGVNTSYSYDSLSRLLSVGHQTSSASLDGAAYAYDAAGNRTSRTAMPASVTTNYSYDPVYQLLTAKQGATTKESYTYDAVGNRTNQPGAPYTYNSSNEMLTREGVPYTYDSNGNLLSKTNGSGATSYAWDFENRLSSVTLPTGSAISFTYDPFGRRIRKVSPAGSTIYVYDGDNIIEDLDGSGNLVERYTYGPGVDEPLVGQRQPKIFYYEADGLGSVTSLTDPTGAVAATYTYDSFGFLTSSTGSATNWFRYTARQFDSDTALYYYRARYYDPTAGRFISEDPARFSESTNFYPYVGSNPLTYKDSFGQGIVDCAAEIARLAYLEGVKAGRLAEQAAASCKDKNHQKSIDQIQNAIDKQRARVIRHCSDADTKKQLLLTGAIALAIALAPETGGGSLVPALAGVF